MGELIGIGRGRGSPERLGAMVFFSRTEWQGLLGLYHRYLCAGVWRNYAVQWRHDQASFAAFRDLRRQADLLVVKRVDRYSQLVCYEVTMRNKWVIKTDRLEVALKRVERLPRLVWSRK